MKFVTLLMVILFSACGYAASLSDMAQPISWPTMIQDWVGVLSQVLSCLVIIATVLVRVIPGQKYKEAVEHFGGWLFKILQWLPTLGINPQTKKLQEAYDELKAEYEALKAKEVK